MQNLDIELGLGLERDEPHRRPGRRLGDRLGVAVVVLLCLDIGTNILRRHQPHLVSLRGQKPPEVVRATARLHRYDSLAARATMLSRRIRRRSTTRPVGSSPTTLQLFLPKSIPRTSTS